MAIDEAIQCWLLCTSRPRNKCDRNHTHKVLSVHAGSRAALSVFLLLSAIFELTSAAEQASDLESAHVNFESGTSTFQIGDMPGAVSKWSKALDQYKALPGTERNQARCHQSIGAALLNMGDFEEAIAHQKQALAIYLSFKDADLDKAGCYQNIGSALGNLGEREDAIRYLKQSLSAYKAIKSTDREQAHCYDNIGLVLSDMDKQQEAIQHHERALAIYESLKGTEWEQANCNLNLGKALERAGNNAEAVQRYNKALICFGSVEGTEQEQATLRNQIQAIEVRMGKAAQGLPNPATDTSARADELFKSGIHAGQTGDAAAALQAFSDSLRMYESISGTKRQQAICHAYTAISLIDLGKYKEALHAQEQALAIFNTIAGSEGDRAECYFKIGYEFRMKGEHELAIQHLKLALAGLKKLAGAERRQADCNRMISLALVDASKLDEAIRYQVQALELYKPIPGTERDQANCNMSIGVGLGMAGKFEQSIEPLKLALTQFETIEGTVQEQAICAENIGKAMDAEGKYNDAIAYYKRALALLETMDGTENDQLNLRDAIKAAATKKQKLDEVTAAPNSVPEAQRKIVEMANDALRSAVEAASKNNASQSLADSSRALALYETIPGTERHQAVCQKFIGLALHGTGENEKALQHLEKALSIFGDIKESQRDQASCHVDIGEVLVFMSKDEEASLHFRQAIEGYSSISGSERDTANCYRRSAVAWFNMKNYEQAVHNFEQALPLYGNIEDTEREQAECHKKMGLSFVRLGRYGSAWSSYEKALAIFKTIQGAKLDCAECYRNIGVSLDEIGAYNDAITNYNQALATYAGLKGTERQQAECFAFIGSARNDMRMYEDAIQATEKGYAIFTNLPGTERDQAWCRVRIGISLNYIGKHEDGIQRYEEALKAFKTLKGSERDQAACLNNLGIAQSDMGRYEQARKTFELALAIYERIGGDELSEAGCHQNIGTVLYRMRKYQESVQFEEQALALYKKITNTGGGQLTYRFVNSEGDEFLPLTGTESSQWQCWGIIGDSLRSLGKYDESIAAYDKALVRGWWIRHGLGLAVSQRNLPGDDVGATMHFLAALGDAEGLRSTMFASEHREGVFDDKSQIVRDFVDFLVTLDKRSAIEGKSGASGPAEGARFGSVQLSAAFQYADQGKGRSLEDSLREKLVLKSARPDSALLVEDQELSQRISKLSSLREPLPEADEQRKKLSDEIDAMQQRRNLIEVELKKTALGDYVAPEFRKPKEMAQELEADRAVLQYSVGEKEGWLLVMTREGITAHKLGAETPALPEMLSRQEATVAQLAEAWKNRPDKIGLDGLVRLARVRAEDAGKRASERSNLVDAGQEQVILGRLAAVVLPDAALAELRTKGIRRLLVIPDGSLHYVPFAMLRVKDDKKDGTHYLVEEFASSYVPAMTTLDTIRKQKLEREKKRSMGRRALLAFANPAYGSESVPSLPVSVAKDDMVTRLRSFRDDYYKGGGLKLTSLPETEQEAVRIASLFAPPQELKELSTDMPDGDAVVFTGNAASEDAVKRLFAVSAGASAKVSLAPRWKYVVFSTHGFADTHNGMLSCLALSTPDADSAEDGFIQAQEVMNLELDTDVVMLSACQTGLGRLRGGEGLVGLSAAFFYAGTESVCASLWQVPSGPTTQLVPEFFKHLKERGADRAEALRQAQLTVLREGKDTDGKPADYASPFCWAAFVLMGEYR